MAALLKVCSAGNFGSDTMRQWLSIAARRAGAVPRPRCRSDACQATSGRPAWRAARQPGVCLSHGHDNVTEHDLNAVTERDVRAGRG